MRPRRLRWLLLAPGLVAGAPAHAADGTPERPALYKWVDANGIAHYTTDPERIPPELRGLVRERENAGAAGSDAWAARDAAPAPVDTAPPDEHGVRDSDAHRAPGAVDSRELDERIAVLEQEIARDEERIKAWVSDPAVDPVTLADDPEFRELAARLPRLQADLRALREQKQGGQP